jgi:multiple sugar transport system substrate-binding protein
MIATLRSEITAGILQPGDFLPSELSLGEQYDLSKNTIRKGLDVLYTEGYIEKIPRIGNRVVVPKDVEGVTIQFGYYSSMEKENNLAELINAFQKRYPHIHVNLVRTHRVPEHYLSQLLSDNLDVIAINLFDFNYLKASLPDIELFEPLEEDEDTYPFLKSPFAIDGALYAQPLVFSPVILCYNKEHFQESNMSEPDSSWTWDDVREAGKRLANPPHRYGLYFHIPSENRWPLFLLQHNARFQKDEKEVFHLRDDQKIKDGLRTGMKIIGDKEMFPSFYSENDYDVQALFASGKVSMVICTYDFINAFRDIGFAYDIAPVPHCGDPKTLTVIIGLGIRRMSQNKQAAKLFVDYMKSYEAQLLIRCQTLSIPAAKLAAEWVGEEPIANRPRRYHMYREIIPTFHFFSELGIPPDKIPAIRNELIFYWSQLNDLDSVLKRIEEKLNEKD